jgi:hypothetical protein
VGEIGRDRMEYLYDMSYCDILLIQRGYRRRNILQYQLQRLQAFGAFFCMSGTTKTPENFLPLYVDRYIDDDDPLLPDKEQVAAMIAEIDAINAHRNRK